jgi:hypothetical protein
MTHAGVTQLVEYLPSKQAVEGSSPFARSKFLKLKAPNKSLSSNLREGFFIGKSHREKVRSSTTSTKVQHIGLFLSVKEAAQKLDVTPMTITRWCESGKLPAMAKTKLPIL